MVPFYGTVYKSILYDLIIPFPACESGAEREKRRAVVLRPGRPEKANNLIINSLWIVFYVEWHQLITEVVIGAILFIFKTAETGESVSCW